MSITAGIGYADSTDHYRVTSDIALKWTENVITSARIGVIPDGSGKNGLSVSSGVGKTLVYENDYWIGFRFYFDSQAGWGGQGPFCLWSATNSNTLVMASIEHDGTISLWAGSRNTLIGNSGTVGFSLHGQTSYYVEFHFSTSGGSAMANITGTAAIWVNGVSLAIGGSGDTGWKTTDTLNGTNQGNYFQFQDGNVVNGKCWVRDLYITTGLSSPYGDIGLGADFPATLHSNSGWAAVGAATLPAACNPQYPDINDDTIYIKDDNPTDLADFIFTPLATSETIPFVHLGAYHKKDAEGTRTFQFTVNGATCGPIISPGDDYRYDFVFLPTDPSGSPWTVAVFNATAFGIQTQS